MYKLAVFDLDGTLLTSEHQVSSATYGALKDLKRNDIEVVISSGRPLPGVKKFKSKLEKNWCVIFRALMVEKLWILVRMVVYYFKPL